LKWSELRASNDATTRALAVIGDRWTLVLLAQCIRGVARFDDLQRSHGLSRSVVSGRLKLLTEEGILRRTHYRGQRYEYRLTEKGEALVPLFSAIESWARIHASAGPTEDMRAAADGEAGDPSGARRTATPNASR